MGEGLVLKLVHGPVSGQEASLWSRSVGTTSSSHLQQPASPGNKKRLCSYRTVVPKHKSSEKRMGKGACPLGTDLGTGIYTKGTVHSLHFLSSTESLRDIILGLGDSYLTGDLCIPWFSTNDHFRIVIPILPIT